ncbi:ABC transporter permease, partial [bacterium]|nr:ABC transporter permease [bacterium]
MLGYFMRAALLQIARYRVQSALAMLGVAVGTANIIVLISLVDLGRRQSMNLINDLGANVLIVMSYIDMQASPLSRISTSSAAVHLPSEMQFAVASLPEIELAGAIFYQPGHVTHGDKQWYTTLAGVSPEMREIWQLEVEEGRWLSEEDDDSAARLVCLGSTAYHELFDGGLAVGEKVMIRGIEFIVAGTMASKGRIGLEDFDNRTFMPLRTAQEIFDVQGVHAVFARYRDEAG